MVTRCGDKDSGVTTYAASPRGSIKVLVFNNEDGDPEYIVDLVPSRGVGDCKVLAEGKFGETEETKRKEAMDKLHATALARWDAVLAQREKILEAFIAETGLKPSEVIQIEQRTPDGMIWYPAKKGDPILRREECCVYYNKAFDETGAS